MSGVWIFLSVTFRIISNCKEKRKGKGRKRKEKGEGERKKMLESDRLGANEPRSKCEHMVSWGPGINESNRKLRYYYAVLESAHQTQS